MIASLIVALPYSLAISESDELSVYETTIDGYEVRFLPPVKTETPAPDESYVELTMKGEPAFFANGLRVDFHREQFDLRAEIQDPPHATIRRIVHSWLSRLRVVSGAFNIVPVEFPSVRWSMRYLNDDGTELEEQEGQGRGREGGSIQLNWNAIDSQVWDAANRLSDDFEPRVWVSLLLDARKAIPDIGMGVVLAHTALEVCVAHVLDDLARIKGIPDDMWRWINTGRSESSVSEQLDAMLIILSGQSLKQDNNLWEGFRNIGKARNSFVHQGEAKIDGVVVSVADAKKLIDQVNDIFLFLRELLPEANRWPVYQFDLQVRGRANLGRTLSFP